MSTGAEDFAATRRFGRRTGPQLREHRRNHGSALPGASCTTISTEILGQGKLWNGNSRALALGEAIVTSYIGCLLVLLMPHPLLTIVSWPVMAVGGKVLRPVVGGEDMARRAHSDHHEKTRRSS